ncbi:MAG: hypothetical protein ABW252_03150 [Polyangiales bacterium]
MTRFTPRLLMLAAAMAGLVACDNAKQAEQAQQNKLENQQEAAKDQAELTNEQRQEQAKLNQNQAEQQRDLAKDENEKTRELARGEDAKDVAEERNEMAKDRADLHNEQQKERADLNKDQHEEQRDLAKDKAEERADDQNKVAKKTDKANEDRAEIVNDSREKLRELDTRLNELQQKAAAASPKEKTQVTTALATFPKGRQALERDIEALGTVQATNLNRAKTQVENKLSGLDKILDKAESRL